MMGRTEAFISLLSPFFIFLFFRFTSKQCKLVNCSSNICNTVDVCLVMLCFMFILRKLKYLLYVKNKKTHINFAFSSSFSTGPL